MSARRSLWGLVFLSGCAAAASQSASENRPGTALVSPDAMGLLQRAAPSVQWDATRALSIDVNGDREVDLVVVGKGSDQVSIGIVVGPIGSKAKTNVLVFPVGKKTQDSLCASTVHVTAEDPRLPLGEWGCDTGSDSSKCSGVRANDAWLRTHTLARGIRVDDEQCDSLHLYWDAAKSAVSWWRL